MNQAMNYANEAVFILQMNSADAIRYIQRNSSCSLDLAEKAFKRTVMFHKK